MVYLHRMPSGSRREIGRLGEGPPLGGPSLITPGEEANRQVRSFRSGASAGFLALVMGLVALGYSQHGVVAQTKGQDEEKTAKRTGKGNGNRQRQPRRGMGVLVGRVTRGPLSPVGGIAGLPSSAPVPRARVLVSGPDGRQVKSAITDAHGEYRIRLPAGSYRVEMDPLPDGGWTKDLPATVTISGGRQTRLDIGTDTGIR
jgi:hypothetical protein